MVTDLVEQLRESIRKRENLFGYSQIYLVGENALAKSDPQYFVKNEYKFGKFLQENGVSVPEMYQLVEPDPPISIPFDPDSAIKKWFVIMEKVRGQHLNDLPRKVREEAVRQYREELRKVLELGICPEDSNWLGNSIFSDEDKLYLLDFEYWHNGTKPELDQFYKKIDQKKFFLGREFFFVMLLVQ